VREAEAWGAILAAIGFFHLHLSTRDGPLRRMLSEAIFPFYIIHQTIIVVTGFYLDELQLPLIVEAPLLIGATALGCWLFYQLARRTGPLRVVFGLSGPEAKPALQPALNPADSPSRLPESL
jgi:surface polysaccharide O-acyltransferase-like enzyme